MMKNLKLDDILNDRTANDSAERFAFALHTYINYDDIAKDAQENGRVMKESREHYEYLVLRELENLFKDKSKLEIALKVIALFY